MDKVINMQAHFTVKFAKNIIELAPAERQAALAQMPNKGVALIKAAIEMIEADKNKRNSR